MNRIDLPGERVNSRGHLEQVGPGRRRHQVHVDQRPVAAHTASVAWNLVHRHGWSLREAALFLSYGTAIIELEDLELAIWDCADAEAGRTLADAIAAGDETP